MANIDAPRGFKPVRYVSGAPYNGSVNIYSTAAGDATAIYVGDPVTIAASGTAQVVNGDTYADVDQAATGNIVTGVVVSVLPDTRDSLVYRAASTLRLLAVCDDPDVLFEIQEVSGGTALTANAIGLNADFVVASGSATTGFSGVELNNSGEASTNTLDVKLIGIVNRVDNAIGEHCKWLVRINRHRYANQVAGDTL